MLQKIVLSITVLVLAFRLNAQLVINEISQGTGTAEYVELVVTGTKTCTDSTANIQGWIIDDNCGFYGGDGIAGGNMKFSSHPQWASIKYGSIILLFNSASVYPGIVADETDANGDNVYVLPSTSAFFETNTAVPVGGTAIATYTTSGYVAGGSIWDALGMRNGGDVFHTVNPTNLAASHHSIGWGSASPTTDVYFNGSASGYAFHNVNALNNDFLNQANWDTINQTLGTPGVANSPNNLAWINSMSLVISGSYLYDTINETICATDSFLFNSNYYNISGMYTDTISCDSIVTLNLNIQSCIDCNLDLGNDTIICGAVNYTLDAGIFNEYLWQDNSTNQSLTATGIGQYWCQATNFDTTNLFVNGDFESGIINFATDYTPGSGGAFGLVSSPGEYAISTSPSLVHNNFNNCVDHTSGSGNMMIVNGSNTPNQAVWCQTIPINANTDYYFSIWAISVENTNAANVAELFFEINGAQIGNVFSPSFTSCNWQQYNQTWNSGALTTATICIYNHTTSGNNDFAIDDIFFGEACLVSDTVNILGQSYTIDSSGIEICYNDSVLIFGNYENQTGLYEDTLVSILGCDSVYLQRYLTIGNPLFSSANISICFSDSVFLEGAWQKTTNVYYDTLVSSTMCDSFITTNLVVSPLPNSATLVNTCTNNPLNAQNTIDTLVSILGCDSLYNYTTIRLITPDSVLIQQCTNDISLATINYVSTLSVQACDSFTQIQAIVYEQLDIDTLTPLHICEGESEIIFGNTETQTGLYEDTLISGLGCDSLILIQTLTVNPLPIVSAGQDTTIAEGDNIIITVSGANSYTWNTGETSSILDLSLNETTTFYVSGIDDNNCEDIDSITIFVLLEEIILAVPTGFSPNGDNINDAFRILNENLFENISLRVYNRWGEMIFSNTTNISSWNGKYKNVDQDIGNYIYSIEATAIRTQEKFEVSGSISLIR